MASDDWMAENLAWSSRQQTMFESMAHETDALHDELLQQVFDVGFFNMDVSTEDRIAARAYVVEALREDYGFEFDEYFDWRQWRDDYAES
jgi:hypothetical protein